MNTILPYSADAFSNFYEEEFITGFTHRSLATGKCESQQAQQFLRKLNAVAIQFMPYISFNEEMLTGSQLEGGACSAISFRVATETLKLKTNLQERALRPFDKEKLFVSKFMQIMCSIENIATSNKTADKILQTTLRTEQLALNTITANRERLTGNAISEKISAMAPFYGLHVRESSAELRIRGNKLLETELANLMEHLQDGVYLLRIIQEKYNHKLEEQGHSAVYVKNLSGEYYFDPALGSFTLLNGDRPNLIYNALLSANERFNVDTLSFHLLEELNSIVAIPFNLRELAVYGKTYYPNLISQSTPVIIFSPGLGQLSNRYKEIAEALSHNGLIVIAINFPNNGIGEKQMDLEHIIACGLENAGILTHLIKLVSKGVFNKKIGTNHPIGVMGHSLGGSISIEACQKTDCILAALNMDGRILNPIKVSQPVMQFVASKTKEDRIAYNEALQALMADSLNVKCLEMPVSHNEFSNPDPALLRQIVDLATSFFKQHLEEKL